MSNEYRITWVIELSGDTPRHAAAKALHIQQDRTSTANAFTVEDVSTGREFEIDLDMNPLDTIHAILDGQKWDADLPNRIVDVLEASGYTVRDPSEIDEED